MKLSTSLSPMERKLGWLLMAGQLIILPIVFSILNSLLAKPLSITVINFLLFLTEFLMAYFIFHRFLAISTRKALRKPFECLRYAVLGLLLYFLFNYLINLAIMKFCPNYFNANNTNVYTMAQDNYTLVYIGTVFLAPFTEELLYRGVLFCPLERKNRVLAYIVSASVFSLIHIVGYIGVISPINFLISFIQYLPAGICFAWAYEKSDNIWTPILMHITNNQISISIMR